MINWQTVIIGNLGSTAETALTAEQLYQAIEERLIARGFIQKAWLLEEVVAVSQVSIFDPCAKTLLPLKEKPPTGEAEG